MVAVRRCKKISSEEPKVPIEKASGKISLRQTGAAEQLPHKAE